MAFDSKIVLPVLNGPPLLTQKLFVSETKKDEGGILFGYLIL